ncbi:MAG: polysaccharide pyruvyl transferase family protein, partial [Candidatus Omnitrophota bacterium]
MSIRIGLITTLNVNFGDDLVREGICLVLEEIFKDKNIEFIPICKHEPLTAYPLWHPLRHIHGLIWPFIKRRVNARRIIEKIARPISKMGFSKFDECDMIVQCGAPVMWNGCAKSEWSEFLWHQIVGRLGSSGKPVLNIGGGSCYPWERQPDSVTDEKDVFFLKKIFSYCKITTVRDKLAQRIFNSLDCDCPLIACPALIAGGSITAEGSGDFVLVNYMKKGGHYDFDQDIDESIWRNTFISVIERFKKRHKLLFLCHNQEEYKLAYEIDPGIPR